MLRQESEEFKNNSSQDKLTPVCFHLQKERHTSLQVLTVRVTSGISSFGAFLMEVWQSLQAWC